MHITILQNCYVHSESLRIVAHDLDVVITDTIPAFLKAEGTLPLKQSDTDAGGFGILMSESVVSERGQLYLLLGGIGSGKTTFLKRYQRTVGKHLLDTQTLWFPVDFLSAPLESQRMEHFVWSTILESLRTRYKSPHLETRKNIKRAFADEIATIEHTALRGHRQGSDEYEKALSHHLEKWQADVCDYVPRLLALCKPRKDIKVVLFIDNVDQLSPAYQAQIFLLAQRVTRRIGSITIVALREESYYTASVQKTFTAYTNRKFHIASPRFLIMIGNRIGYAVELLGKSDQLQLVVPDGAAIVPQDIADYLTVVGSCIFEGKRVIVNFIEALCFGNMRLALQMFTTFLASGATDVDKMLRIYRRDGSYSIAYHEFVKSIMLGDRKYYKETFSPVMNVFDCGIEKNASHFTCCRILSLLLQCRGQATKEGRGYFEISQAAAIFEDVFDNREDFVRSMNRLVQRQLVEVNTRSTEGIQGASHARVTSSGWYYAQHLVGSFCYLDLVLQDTPVNSEHLAKELRDSVKWVDNLYDSEDQKIERVQSRFARVEKFLDYLEAEEDEDFRRFELGRLNSLLSQRITAPLRTDFQRQKEWITRRLAENREKIMDEPFFRLSEEDVNILDSFLSDHTEGKDLPDSTESENH